MIDPKTIMAGVVALIILAVGTFAFFTVTDVVDENIPGGRITNVESLENFNSETVNTEPNTTFLDYTAYEWTTPPGINGTTGAFNYTVDEVYGCSLNYSRWNISTNEIGFPNRIDLDITQGPDNQATVVNITNDNEDPWVTIYINDTFISVSIGATEYINRTEAFSGGLFEEITYRIDIDMIANVTQTVRCRMYNATGLMNNDTGAQTPSQAGPPGKITVSGLRGTEVTPASSQQTNISIDDIRVWAQVWPTQSMVDVAPIGNSVFGIIGIVLIIAAIMSIIGVVYTYTKR